MIEINLAPGAETRRSSGRRTAQLQLPKLPRLGADTRVLGLGAAGVLVLFVLGFAIWRQGARQEELQTRLEQEVADSTRFASTIALIGSLRANQDTINQKIEVIRAVDQRRYVWPHLMDEISRAVPAYTWLTELTSGETADTLNPGPVFTLEGNAGSTQALTRFMKNLETSPFIRGVTLVTSEQVDVEGRSLHRFTLEARYEAPGAEHIETVPVIVIE